MPDMKTLNGYEIFDAKARESIGDLTDLETQNKGSLIAAINEVLSYTGAGGSEVSIKNTGEVSFTVTPNMPVPLSFNFSSLIDDDPTGPGTAKVYVGGALKHTQSIQQGENTIDVRAFLSVGENTIKLEVSDVYNATRTLTYTANVIELSISSPFNDSIFHTGDVTFKYTPVGLIEKTIHFVIDEVEVRTAVVSTSGKQFTEVFPAMSHGAHRMAVYATAEVGGQSVSSKPLIYDVICIEEGNETIIIGCAFEDGETTAGSLLEIPFTVYDPSAQTAELELSIWEEEAEEAYATQTRTVDRTRQLWSTRQYPDGAVRFIIACGDVTRTINMTVAASDIPVEAVTNDLELHLSSVGRSNGESDPAVWEYADIATTFDGVNWVGTGWVTDENGDTVLRLMGDARAEIGIQPFSTDLRQYGKTIELEFAIRDVNNRDAVVISCLSGGVGIKVTADRAVLYSEQDSVDCRYKDGEKIRVSFVVESINDNRLMLVYLNGILSAAKQYTATDNFRQNTPVAISIGSDLCTLDLYTVRSYDTALTADEIRDNYIADTTDVAKKKELFDANNIYDAYGSLSYDALLPKIPVMVIVGALPTYKGDKKTVAVSYLNPFSPGLNFEDTATIDVQGTSSQWYVRKNWKIKTGEYHRHALGQMAAKVFCMKADYAEATGTHNTGNANYVHTLYDAKTPPQELDDTVRTTIYGFPCVIYHKETEASAPVFIGKYNFNYDKGAENVFGFDAETYPECRCWEFCNNTSDACLFHGPVPASWGDDFEARFPDGSEDIASFKTMHDWVVSTWQAGATGEALDPAVTYDGVQYTTDTAEYRLAKFKAEFENYFDMDFTLLYYVYTLVMLMVDQRAKNMFLTTWDGIHWQPWLYDNDTCLGINNEGQLVFDYYHEDIDLLGDANVYNGQESALWVNFRMAFPDRIEALYQKLRSDKKLTFEKVEEAFITNQADKWSISVYNEDADYKYVSMLRSDDDASNLNQIRGSGKEHLGYFVDNRLMYMDSKFYAGDYVDDYISLRIYTPSGEQAVTPNANITVTPFSNFYAGVRYKANGTLQQARAEKNTPITFEAPAETFNDTETAIYGASQLSSIGDLSPLYCGSINIAKATKLTELICGSAVEGYSNPNLKEVSVGTNRLLMRIDVRNCPNLTGALGLSNCPNMEEIYATGSGITTVELPNSGYLKKVYLPGTVTNLTIQNQEYIEEFECESYDALSTLRVENSNGVPVEAIVTAASNLQYVRLTSVDWTLSGVDTLIHLTTCGGLDENGIITATPVVSGRAHVPTITASQLAQVNETFPDLVVTYTNVVADCTITFKDWDGKVLDVQYVPKGGSAEDPVTAGRITTPTREATAQYTYTYSHWGGDYTNVTGDVIITAVYTSVVNQYIVRFFNGSAILEAHTVPYGSSVTYGGTTPLYNGETEGVFVFTDWSEDTSFVGGNIDTYALYEKCELPETVTAFSDCTWAQVKAVAEAGYKDDNGDWAIDGTVWWSVGDEKVLTMSDGEEIIVQLYDFEHDDRVAGDKAPLTIGMKNTMATDRRMNSSMTNDGGWPATELRTVLNTTIFDMLPSTLRGSICDVYKSSTAGLQSTEIVTSADKLFLFAIPELFPSDQWTDYAGEGSNYPIFTADAASRQKYNSAGDTLVNYMTRSPYLASDTNFQIIYGSSGNPNSNTTQTFAPNRERAVCFGFCI